jgi:hypothetical protein
MRWRILSLFSPAFVAFGGLGALLFGAVYSPSIYRPQHAVGPEIATAVFKHCNIKQRFSANILLPAHQNKILRERA